MKQMALSKVKDDLSKFLRMAESEEIIITKHGGAPAHSLLALPSGSRLQSV